VENLVFPPRKEFDQLHFPRGLGRWPGNQCGHFLGGGASFSPVFGLDVYPWSIITVPLYPVIMGYAILHYQLFRIKVVTAQMLAVIIFAVSYFRFFLANSTMEYYLNA
jgi:hypothetical protein